MRTFIAVAVAVSALAAGPALACEWKNQSVSVPQTSTDTAELPQTPMPGPAKPAG